ncbi:basic helix-loop-helix (bHLH) DNA-binding superfamily protein [Artemisia annua]|uniref:Basic helix-loop-helix (BHLH) DNA-binding superfamily protein n=1 Tax=Artemisia annua TaxID=35608 RepID=A0A2U1MFF3_ARTAN|nr:basic helix-loop-helix (bHLH) DNA-binding superfamily protein [Artemisia annua]
MYPSSNSSTSRDPNNINNNTNGDTNVNQQGIGLARYRSAPVSFLTTTVDSVINGQSQQQSTVGNHMSGGGGTPIRFFSPPDTTSSQLSSVSNNTNTGDRVQTGTSFRLNEFATAFNGMKSTSSQTQNPSPLFRHGSSPAGFLNTLVSSTPTDGRGSRLGSQLSFTGTNSYSRLSEEPDIGNSLMFSSSSSHNKRAKIDVNGLNIMESELNFGLSESALEAAAMEKIMDLPHDSVPCKIRAKRGCATHPRSIAERNSSIPYKSSIPLILDHAEKERRTRISGKLKKLQDLVPNMDKQTSYSDMLDLAVQHIKGLQTHVQNNCLEYLGASDLQSMITLESYITTSSAVLSKLPPEFNNFTIPTNIIHRLSGRFSRWTLGC